MAQGEAATVERRDEPSPDQEKALVKHWLKALSIADAEEKEWRADAEKVIRRFRGEGEHKDDRFRLLYSNVETMAPALFNSEPVPDIRRRFGDRDEDARQVAQALERTISCQAEKSDFEAVMEEATLHRLLPGRAVVRVRYEPKFAADKSIAYENVAYEVVPWQDFRRGPAKRWKHIPWLAFRIYPTRDDLVELSPKHGKNIPLTAKSNEDKEGQSTPTDVMKRAEVWQIWDKEKREVVYICPEYKDAPVAVVPDPLELEAFFPTPEPLLAIRSPDDLRPITEWSQYCSLAEELEDITKRLRKLVKAAKWRGVVAKELGPAFKAMEMLEDGQFAAAEDGITFSNEGGISQAIWMMPIAELVAAINELYKAREQTKQTIYEVTGLADILRGSTAASETATAQQIKAQWGSLRLQKGQRAIQRYCRDLYRLGVEIIATRFDPKSIMLASGIQLSPEQIGLMKRDVMREYRIDVETDSTIRADLTRQQENIGQFVQGFGALVTSLGPVVQDGTMPGDVAADLLTGFARSFKLGRQAEEALERLGDQAKQAAQNPQQKPDPEMIKLQADQARAQQEMAFKQQSHEMDMQARQADLAMKEKELELKEREMQMRLQEINLTHQFKVADLQANQVASRMKHDMDMERLAASQSIVPPSVARQ